MVRVVIGESFLRQRVMNRTRNRSQNLLIRIWIELFLFSSKAALMFTFGLNFPWPLCNFLLVLRSHHRSRKYQNKFPKTFPFMGYFQRHTRCQVQWSFRCVSKEDTLHTLKKHIRFYRDSGQFKPQSWIGTGYARTLYAYQVCYSRVPLSK